MKPLDHGLRVERAFRWCESYQQFDQALQVGRILGPSDFAFTQAKRQVLDGLMYLLAHLIEIYSSAHLFACRFLDRKVAWLGLHGGKV